MNDFHVHFNSYTFKNITTCYLRYIDNLLLEKSLYFDRPKYKNSNHLVVQRMIKIFRQVKSKYRGKVTWRLRLVLNIDSLLKVTWQTTFTAHPTGP